MPRIAIRHRPYASAKEHPMAADEAKQRVLIVEDEIFIGMLLEDIVLGMDDYAVDLFANFNDGLQAARTGPYALAILDVNLDGVRSFPIADVLSERGVPFVFLTGYGAAGLDPAYAGQIVLHKPFQSSELRHIIAVLARKP